MKQQICEEHTGLFIVRNCENPATIVCDKCKKNICTAHAFECTDTQLSEDKKHAVLCLSCFTEFDARLTSDYELYSKDRAVWRRKMLQRFHDEYPYMQFLAENYGSLFDTTESYYMIGYSDDDDSYFDS